jgi:membrane protein DedA with SNARE-associated domain
MISSLWGFVSGFGEAWYPLFLGVTAMVETLFPPFPGDVVFVALSGLGIQNGVSRLLLWIPGFTGCFISTIVLDSMGRSSRLEKLERVITGSAKNNGMERAKKMLADRGPWIIAFSRFIPGIRSILVIAGAASGMKRSAVLFYSGLSAAAWYLLLVIASGLIGSGIAGAREFMSSLTQWLWAASILALVIGGVVLVCRLKQSGK